MKTIINRNKKGGSILLGIVSGLMIFMVGMLLVNFLKTDIDTARIDLDCTNSSITDGTKLTCLGTDIAIPYAFIVILSIAGGAIFGRYA